MSNRPLRRGRACMNCRFLKIKCDGVKPICGPCRKSPKDDECEYQDGPARSRTKALEDTVARLEARLQELEHPEENTPSVTLYDPYSQYSAGGTSASPQLSVPPPLPPHFSRSLPNSPFAQVPRLLTATSSSSPESSQLATPFSPGSATRSVPPYGSHGPGSSPLGLFDSRLPSERESPELTSPGSTTSSVDYEPLDYGLLQKFLEHASEFGFFLDPERFVSLHPSHHTASPALLFAMSLWSAHLSSDTHKENRFKRKALQSSATALTDSATQHSQYFLHTLQAEVLLAYYFFRTGAFLAARTHTATAFALALGGGLHLIRSASASAAVPPSPAIAIDRDTGQPVPLPGPQGAFEEGERINAFWAAFVLQKNLSMVLEPACGASSIFETAGAGGMQIDTPWPLEMDEYKRGLLTPGIQGDATVLNYLHQTLPATAAAGSPYPDGRGHGPGSSLTAQTVKACILLHRTAYIRAQWTNTRTPPDARDAQFLTGAFHAADGLIQELRAQLPAIAHLDIGLDPAARARTRRLFLTHSLLNAATIKLHGMFMASDPGSRERCLGAAREMFRFGGAGVEGLKGMGYLNPIIGTLWTTAYDVFVSELRRINATPGWRTADGEKEAHDVRERIQDGLLAFETFASQSLLMHYELTQAKEAAAAVDRMLMQ